MKNTLPPVCLFDMDGTLVDSSQLILCAWRHAHQKICPHLDLDEKTLVSLFGRPSKEVIKGIGIPERFQANYLREFRSYMLAHRDRIRLMPGVEKVLKYLDENNVRMAIITGARTGSAKYILNNLGIIQYFKAIVGGDATSKGKPHPDPIIKALTQLGINERRRCIPFIGDSINDVMAAHAAEITPIYLCHENAHTLHQKIKNYNGLIIHHITEVIPLLKHSCSNNYNCNQ